MSKKKKTQIDFEIDLSFARVVGVKMREMGYDVT